MQLKFDLGQTEISVTGTNSKKKKKKRLQLMQKKYISMEYKFKNECILKSSPECL